MKTVKDYLTLPYSKVVRWSPADEAFVASVKEIPACHAHGATETEALQMLGDNLEDWIAFAIDEGDPIPIPEDEAGLPSGKWLQRVPRSLHKRLVECAEADGVSLNTFVSNTLALAVGSRQGIHGAVSLDASARPDAPKYINVKSDLLWKSPVVLGSYLNGPLEIDTTPLISKSKFLIRPSEGSIGQFYFGSMAESDVIQLGNVFEGRAHGQTKVEQREEYAYA